MVNIDDLYKRAVSRANNVALAGVLAFGFFFVALVASDKLPQDVRWPMQLVMMIAATLSAAMIIAAPFLKNASVANDVVHGPDLLPPPGSPDPELELEDWRDYAQRTKRK